MSDLLIFIRNSVEPNMWLNVNDNREFLIQNNFRCESSMEDICRLPFSTSMLIILVPGI